MKVYRIARHVAILGLVVAGVGVSAPPVHAQDDMLALIRERAAAHGVANQAEHLVNIVACESGFRPWVVGDSGHSHGLVQLSDLDTGLLSHFHAQGYGSAYDAWSSADYLARVATGEWARAGITLRRWSCA